MKKPRNKSVRLHKVRRPNDNNNFKNKNHRRDLYNRTFMKHNLESRLFTLQQAAIDLSSKAGYLALDMTVPNFDKFAEVIGDIETTIEFIKLSIPPLQQAATDKRYKKLENLKERTDKADEQKEEASADLKPASEDSQKEEASANLKLVNEDMAEATEKTAEAVRKFAETIKKKKTLLDYLLFWHN